MIHNPITYSILQSIVFLIAFKIDNNIKNIVNLRPLLAHGSPISLNNCFENELSGYPRFLFNIHVPNSIHPNIVSFDIVRYMFMFVFVYPPNIKYKIKIKCK